MSEEVLKKGRKPGQILKAYINVNDNIRIAVEKDCLTVEECTESGVWSNSGYFNSWNGVLDYLVKICAYKKMLKRETLTFLSAKNVYLDTLIDIKNVLIGDIEKELKNAKEEIKNIIIKHQINDTKSGGVL